MVKVRRERPSQRLHHRVTAPLMVDLPEGSYKAVDWSLGGFGIIEYAGHAQMDGSIVATVHVPFQGFQISFTCDTQVVRLTDDKQLGVTFVDLGERELEIMSHFVDDLVRGSMTSSGDVIMRIDSPVTPVSTEADPNPENQIPVHRRSLKVLMMTLFYLIAGIGTVSYAGLVLYSNFWRLEVDTAVVSAPIQPILASANGLIQKVSVEPHIDVAIATPLIEISDASLRQAIEVARIEVNRATMELVARQKGLDAEKAKFRDYRSIALSQLAKTNARIRALEKQTFLAKRQADRFIKLADDGWTTRSKLDEVLSAHSALKGQLDETILLRKERKVLLKTIQNGRYFTGNRLEGNLDALSAQVDLHWEHVGFANDELLALERKREQLVLSSPSPGRIVKLLKPRGSTVKRGEQIALFERDEARTIDAYLTQEEVLQIGLGDQATVYFPPLDLYVDAVVLSVDRTNAYLDEVNSQYEWRGPKDRTARVTLGFLDISEKIVRNTFPPGLPAVVIFERRGASASKLQFKKTVSPRPSQKEIDTDTPQRGSGI